MARNYCGVVRSYAPSGHSIRHKKMQCFHTLKGLLDHFEVAAPAVWTEWDTSEVSPESRIQAVHISDVGATVWTLELSRDRGRLPLRQREAVLVDERWRLRGRFPFPEDWDEAARRVALQRVSREV